MAIGFKPNKLRPPASKKTRVAAEGKKLSSKNATKLKTLMSDLDGSSDLLREILDEAGIELESPTQASLNGTQVSAETGFKEWVQDCTWSERLQTTLRIFTYYFDWVAREEPEETTGLISDLTDLLNALASDAMSVEAEEVIAVAASDVGAGIQVQMNVEIQASDDGNNYPIRGVLCKLNQTSEGVPAVGPGLPLYIPGDVAQACIHQVSGLPLDASDTLDEHANEEIVGVILNAAVQGDDFIINGRLWGWNRPEKVEQIKANQRKLGMSMNAYTWGHETEIDGKAVYEVTKLKLLGANILYRDRATYQQTKVIAAHTKTIHLADATTIAASGNNSNTNVNTPGVETEMDDETKKLIQSMATGQESINNSLKEIVATVQTQAQQQQSLQAQVDVLTTESNAVKAATAAVTEEQQRQEQAKQQKESVEEIAAATVRKLLNPTGQPQRLSTPVQASSNESTIDPRQAKLLQLQGSVSALQGRYDQGSRVQRNKFLDEIQVLSHELGLAGGN